MEIALPYLTSTVKRFPANLTGRDFAVGDIHGSFDYLDECMRQIDFDEKNDRLFLVGDLISRGKKSHLCSEFLSRPGIWSVLGNHEAALLELYKNGEPNEFTLNTHCGKNGFQWWLSTSNRTKIEILSAIRKLPLAIEIDAVQSKIGIIHAEVPLGMDWNTFLQKISVRDPATVRSCLWGRNRYMPKDGITSLNGTGVPGIGRLFVGHNRHIDGLRFYENTIALDTGAVYADMNETPGARLTLVNILSSKDVLTKNNLDGRIDVRNDDSALHHLMTKQLPPRRSSMSL